MYNISEEQLEQIILKSFNRGFTLGAGRAIVTKQRSKKAFDLLTEEVKEFIKE